MLFKEVKEIEVFVNKQKIETIQVYNDELQESWQTLSNIIRTFNQKKKSLRHYIIKKHNLWNQKFT